MSEISFASQFSTISQPSQVSTATPMSLSLSDDIESLSGATPIKGWVDEHFRKTIIDGRTVRLCRGEGCKKQYNVGISTRLFKLHWKKAHENKPGLKKTRFLFHDQLHTNRIIKAVIDLH